jgi:hypothetical protein
MRLLSAAAPLLLGFVAGFLPSLIEPATGTAAPARPAASEEDPPPTWERLQRQSALYRRAVLRFTCNESLFEEEVEPRTGAPRATRQFTYRYLLEAGPDRPTVTEYREIVTRGGIPVRSSPVTVQTFVPPPYLWATLFDERNASLFRYKVLGTEKRGVTDTVLVAFEGLLAHEDGARLAEWSGRIWIDRDRLTPVHLEAAPARQEETLAVQLEQYRRAFRLGGLRLKARPRAYTLTVDFLVSRFGLTFPSQSVWRRQILEVDGNRHTERMMRRRFEDYRFTNVRVEEILGEVVDEDPDAGF